MSGTAPQSSSGAKDKVSWGPSTYAGYGVSLVAFTLALMAFIEGDRSEQTLGVLVPGVIGGLSFLVTQLGRYAQAVMKARAPKVVIESVPLQPVEGYVGRLEAPDSAVERSTGPGVKVERLPSTESLTGGPSDAVHRLDEDNSDLAITEGDAGPTLAEEE